MKINVFFSMSLLLGLAIIAWKSPDNDQWKDKVAAEVFIKTNTQSTVDFVVQFAEKPNLAAAKKLKTKEEKGAYVFQKLQEVANASQAKVRQFLESQGVPYQSFYLVNAIHTKGDLQLVQQLAEQEEVTRIIANPNIQLSLPDVQPQAIQRSPEAVEWGIAMIGADQVWAMGYQGQGVVIAGQDTGYEWEHPALKNTYRGWNGTTADHNYNWHDAISEISPLHGDPDPDPSLNPCGLAVQYPCDDHNHGTHTMGTMVGEDGDNQIGVAPEAKWIACRNMERGYGSPVSYIECFEFFLAPTDLAGENPNPAMAPHVINNSWSCPEMEGCNSDNWSMMDDAVNNLKAAGIVVVVSAGNSGPNCETVSTPAAMLENSFTVGATQSNDTIANFSSRGAVTVDGSNRMKPNISAPGRSVRSSIRNGNYASYSGTSMAGPHVAGMVALLISANPALAGQVEVIESIIENTAVPKTSDQECNGTPGDVIPNNTYGYGRIDAVAAIEEALLTTASKNITSNEGQVLVSPNPFTQEIILDFKGLQGSTQFSLFNAAGQQVYTQSLELSTAQSETINFTQLPIGIYFYRVENEGQVLSGKLFKQ